MKLKKAEFPRLDAHRMDIAIRWALRWLWRQVGATRPDERTIQRQHDQLLSAFLSCETHLHRQWVQHNTLKGPKWRQDIRSLRRNPKRLRKFAAKDHLAQILLYGAARAGATDDMETLLAQMEADPTFFQQIISLALEEDKPERTERLLHDPGGRPEVYQSYLPILIAAAELLEEATGRPLGRSTTSETKSDSRQAGKPTGPGFNFLKRLMAGFPERFNDEQIAYLIRSVPVDL